MIDLVWIIPFALLEIYAWGRAFRAEDRKPFLNLLLTVHLFGGLAFFALIAALRIFYFVTTNSNA